jgi:hypothetical protein
LVLPVWAVGASLTNSDAQDDDLAALHEQRTQEVLRDMALRTPPNVGGGLRALLSAASQGLRLSKMDIEAKRDVMDLFVKSARGFLDHWYEDDYIKAAFGFDAVVGNSSSGLYEAPSFRVPTVNIGDRQRGRLSTASVIDCEPTADAITQALDRAMALDCSAVVNPYGDGQAAGRIVAALRAMPPREALLKKHFHLIASAHG